MLSRLSLTIGLVTIAPACATAPTPEAEYAVGSEALDELQNEFRDWYIDLAAKAKTPQDVTHLEDVEATWVALEASALAALNDLRNGSTDAQARWNEARMRVVEWLIKMGAKR